MSDLYQLSLAVRLADLQTTLENQQRINVSNSRSRADALGRIDHLEQRIAAIEAHLGLTPPAPPRPLPARPRNPVAALTNLPSPTADTDDIAALKREADAAAGNVPSETPPEDTQPL